jgi:tetratricopeptide (TPR) repeat protein
MRHPVVRLQPMQQRSAMQRDQLLLTGKERSGESPAGGVGESHISHRERLLKGYHYQLAGDYDAAMQEYRIIIRSTSDLLDEVISNVRALLKLAPKYSAGYRVLGDAYMRQGEYLQAMEAYNKALTMTKKSRGMVS